ncbi:MAG: putative DNA binding domain-containing protein [Deltaproteobacteria bacterium]|jgi:ATP-dependent DNA helicase RecG|nr:putative DNA binding domain-containing protein [Deltaproteobacteria bacterium]
MILLALKGAEMTIPARESETVEFKRSLAQLKEGVISIAAMLNKSREGELWFGIRDDGAPVGFDVGNKTTRDISQAVASNIEPKIFPTVAEVAVKGKRCVKVSVFGAETPYFAYGRAYIRVADEDRRLSAKELENFIIAKHHEALRWDNKPDQATLADLDEEKVKSFVEKAGLPWDDTPNALEKLDLTSDDQLFNAARLFFGKKAAARLRCAVFASTTAATIIDQHDFEGDILCLIEEAQKYVIKNIHIGMRLEGLYRVDVPEISTVALREAVINAFCHRDYRDPEEVRVAIFKDRVEIRNPGGLFGGLTIAELRAGNISKRRNPLVADLLRRIHMVEGWGRGIPLILANEPDVKFAEIAKIFITSFDRKTSGVQGASRKTSATIKTPTETSLKESGRGLSDADMSPKARVVAVIREEPTVTMAEIAARVGISKDGVRYHTDRLKAKGVLRRHGRRNGFWEIV